MVSEKAILHPAILKLKDDIVQQEETLAALRAAGHVHDDAARQLVEMKARMKHIS
jgi:hypothetical protein